ncbi:MAG: hypothetical protein COB93_04965 [Sneathiella sp.]|nr:MAG: hypothetical protein COB93_04965 [Sneathiella sp.]
MLCYFQKNDIDTSFQDSVVIGMQIIKAAFKSNKVVTLLGLGLALLYVVPELTNSSRDLRNASYGVGNARYANAIPLPVRKPGDLPYLVQPHQFDVVSLQDNWSEINFDLHAIRYGQPVPRYFVEQMPVDILDIANVGKRKEMFISVILPLILNANEKTLSRRDRLMDLVADRQQGRDLSREDSGWLKNVAKLYRTDPSDIGTLHKKVDAVPVSIALAQAVEESGWGTSRFAREGNALFGQRIWSEGKGIVPTQRAEGETYEVKAFKTLSDSIASYIHNLNTHPVYSLFRAERARRQVEPENTLNGYKLVETLVAYSERGDEYVSTLQNLIQTNRFDQFEKAQLASERLADRRY